ncbi:MAG: ABC transporter permease [Microbacterium sp.]
MSAVRRLRGLARFASRFVLLLAVTTLLVFIALAVLPGDAVTQQLGLQADETRAAQLRAAYGLDRSVLPRYAEWVSSALRGEFGVVLQTGLPVGQVITHPLERSLMLAVAALLATLLLGATVGIAAGLRAGSRTDRALMSGTMLAISTPEFIVGTALVALFAASLGWLPAVSVVPAGSTLAHHPELLVLPVATLALVAGSMLARQVRALIARENERPHVEAARLAGIPEHRVIVRHLLPGVVSPGAQLVAGVVPYLVGGAVVVERVFGFPGLGSLLVQAVVAREPFLTMAAATILLTISLLAFLTADALTRTERDL